MFRAAFLPITGSSELYIGFGTLYALVHKVYQSRCTAKNPWWWAERLPETCRIV